ncbi:hypothetical protein RJT34_02109 [Clitoria ternatea]|uniref:Uncharacterized protein n=1 Tax=Clitoria ternatea TaxID=43366 RepID=A0AAN9KK21_CLITE
MVLIGTLLGSGEGVNICNIDSSEFEVCRPEVTGDNPPPPDEKYCVVYCRVNPPCLCQYKNKLPSLGIDPKKAFSFPAKCVMPCCAKDHFEITLGYEVTQHIQLGLAVTWFAAVWTIWKIRNDIIFNGGVVNGEKMSHNGQFKEGDVSSSNTIPASCDKWRLRTSDAAVTALELITKALPISLYSEKLLQMKAEALCLLQKYDTAIQLCEQSQHLAEKNFTLVNNMDDFNSSMCPSYSGVKLWRWSLISKCYFHLGRLLASLNVLEKLQHVVPLANK